MIIVTNPEVPRWLCIIASVVSVIMFVLVSVALCVLLLDLVLNLGLVVR